MDALLLVIIIVGAIIMLGISIYLLIVFVHRKLIDYRSRRQGLGNSLVLQNSSCVRASISLVAGTTPPAGCSE